MASRRLPSDKLAAPPGASAPPWCTIPSVTLGRLVGLALLVSCSGGGGSIGAPSGASACDTSDGSLTGKREVHFFASRELSAEPTARALSHYYLRHGLELVRNPVTTTVEMTYALDTDLPELTRILHRDFPGVDLNDAAFLKANPVLADRINTYVARFVFRPVVELARSHGTGGSGHTNVVVLPQLERPGGTPLFERKDRDVAGLALSAALIRYHLQQGTAEGKLLGSLELPPDFTPMMFLHDAVLTKVAAQNEVSREFLVAHEFGHASGLPHHNLESNLMYPTVSAAASRCTDRALDDAQLATMRSELGLGAVRQPLRVETRVQPRAGARFPPERLTALLAGDPEAFREFVRPLVE
jgi:hypothetical protein